MTASQVQSQEVRQERRGKQSWSCFQAPGTGGLACRATWKGTSGCQEAEGQDWGGAGKDLPGVPMERQRRVDRSGQSEKFRGIWAVEVVPHGLVPGAGMVKAEEYHLPEDTGQVEELWLWPGWFA